MQSRALHPDVQCARPAGYAGSRSRSGFWPCEGSGAGRSDGKVGLCVAEWEKVGYSAGALEDRGGRAPPTQSPRSVHFRRRAWTSTPPAPLAFRGHFDYSLDAKHRLNVPPKFRAAFSSGVVLAKALEPCVGIWTPTDFERFTDSFLANLNPLSSERRKLTRFFAGGSFDADLDSAGRVTLNPALLAHAGISREVVVAGVFDHVEVWARERWLADQEELTAEVVGMAEGLGHPS